jgi:hypothetical protein
MDRPFDGIGLDDPARLIGKQVDRVGRVVPEQVVGPRARLALGVDVPAAEEVGLHIHLLDGEFAGPDPVVHVLVRGIEAAGVAHHAHQPGFLLLGDHRLRVGPAVGQRDFDLTCLPASMQAMACAACIWVGVHRITASTSGRASASPRSVPEWRAPYLAATAAACPA